MSLSKQVSFVTLNYKVAAFTPGYSDLLLMDAWARSGKPQQTILAKQSSVTVKRSVYSFG